LRFVKIHDLHFNGSFHAAFLLIISYDRKELFLVRHKLTNNWMIPGGRIDMKGTGWKLLDDEDETPLQCALKEFEEETQQSAEDIIQQWLKIWDYSNIDSTTCDYLLWSVVEKHKKRHIIDDGQVTIVNWKYKIFYTVLNRFDAMVFESKYITQCDIETSKCAWMSYDLIKNRKIQMSNKVYKSIMKIMDMVRQNYKTL
jgi:8-oxo-dGTP pyrophosphatase MutT (NUDIX family)